MSKNIQASSKSETKPISPQSPSNDDSLSNISISAVDEAEDEHLNEIDNVNDQIDEMLTKLRKYFDENSDTVLPSDPTQLRNLLESLTTQVKAISETYSQNLQSMTSINKRLKFQAKDYYDRYKELKKTFDKERKEFQNKKKVIQCEEKLNQEEHSKINKEINDVKNEIESFQKKLGMNNQDNNNNNPAKDDETEIMIEILRSLKEKNVDIYEGLSKDQIDFLKEIMSEEDAEVADNMSNDDSVEGEKFAKAIEDVANRIYNQNLISDIKISQIETNVYSFNDKEVALVFDENDKLRLVNNGMDLETWIVDTFKIAQPPKQAVVVNTKQSKKKTSGGGMKGSSHYKK